MAAQSAPSTNKHHTEARQTNAHTRVTAVQFAPSANKHHTEARQTNAHTRIGSTVSPFCKQAPH